MGLGGDLWGVKFYYVFSDTSLAVYLCAYPCHSLSRGALVSEGDGTIQSLVGQVHPTAVNLSRDQYLRGLNSWRHSQRSTQLYNSLERRQWAWDGQYLFTLIGAYPAVGARRGVWPIPLGRRPFVIYYTTVTAVTMSGFGGRSQASSVSRTTGYQDGNVRV